MASKLTPPKPPGSLRPPPPSSSSSSQSKASPKDDATLLKPSEVAKEEIGKAPSTPPKPPAEALKPPPKPAAPVFRQPTSSALAPAAPAPSTSFIPKPPPPPPSSSTTKPSPPKPRASAAASPVATAAAVSSSVEAVKPAVQPSPPKPAVQPSPPKPAVQPSPPKPAVQLSPPKPTVQPSPPKPTVQPSPPKPVVQHTPTPEKEEPVPIIATSKAPLLVRENSSQRKVQFAQGSPQAFTVPRKQRVTDEVPQRREKGVLGPYSTARAHSAVGSALAFYLLPLVFILIASPWPTLEFLFGDYAGQLAYEEEIARALQQASNAPQPVQTSWEPRGMRETPPVLDTFALSSKATRGSSNGDAVGTCVGPQFTVAYHAQERMLARDGVAFDDAGNGFVCPVHLVDDVDPERVITLLAFDMQTGRSKWNFSEPVVESLFFGRTSEPVVRAGGCGSPLLLSSSTAGEQIVYHATRLRAHALRSTDGEALWTASGVETKVEPSISKEDFAANTMVGGLVHVVEQDLLVGLTADGYMFGLDRATGALQCETKQVFCDMVAVGEEEEVPAEEENPLKLARFETLAPQLLATSANTNTRACKQLSPLVVAGSRLLALAESTLLAVDVLPKEDYYDEFPHRFQLSNVSYELPTTSLAKLTLAPAQGLVFVSANEAGEIHAVSVQDLTKAYALELPPGQVSSLVFAADENALYVSMLGSEAAAALLIKFDLETKTIAWQNEQAMAAPSADIVLTANGALLALEFGQNLGVSGLLLVDRSTGETRSLAVQRNVERIAKLSIGLDGSVFALLDPTKRAPRPDVAAELQHEWTGGVVRWKTSNFLQLARDASCASAKRVANALQYEPGWFSTALEGADRAGREEAKQCLLLAWQAYVATQIGKRRMQVMDALAELVKQQQQTEEDAFVQLKALQPLVDQACAALELLAGAQ